MKHAVVSLLLSLLLLAMSIPAYSDQIRSGAGSSVHPNAVDTRWDDMGDASTSWSKEYKMLGQDAAALGEVIRLKTLVGHPDHGIPDPDIQFGVMEIGPGAIYPAHRHPAPEIYYIVSGSAKWNVDGEMFLAEQGSFIHMNPNAIHSLEVVSDERLFVVWADWAPEGDRSVLESGFELIGRVPPQPEQDKIAREASASIERARTRP